jgi:hypothetical protein
MSDEFETPQGESQSETPSFDDAFSDMENSLDQLPDGDVYVLRHEANPPMYIPAYPGESITIRQACERRHLTLGSNVVAYLDGNQVSLDSPIQAGAVVTLVGSVKGGAH